jgi:hypothetical protein
VSGPFEEISSGPEVDRAPGLRSPRLPRPSWSPSGWVQRHRGRVSALAVAAVLLLVGVHWAWDRAHIPVAADALHVRLDPSEYLLAGTFDGQGQAPVLLLVRVDVAAGFTDAVRLVGLRGGGLQSTQQHPVGPSPTQFAVSAQVSCDQWADGRGVQAVFRVGTGPGQMVSVPLQAGPDSPVHAQITVPCVQFAQSHPLRLTVFSVAPEPIAAAARTTWTVVNRSASPVTLDPADDLQVFGTGPTVPLQPATDNQQPTVVAPHATVSVVRTLVVTSCLQPADLDPTGETVRLSGTTSATSGRPSGPADVDLPFAFVRQVFSVARDTCRGAPDLSAASAVLVLRSGPPGHGSAELGIRSVVTAPGPWMARVESTSDLRADTDLVRGPGVQDLQGPGLLALSVGWTVRTCTSVDTAQSGVGAPLDTVVTLTGTRTYPYVLPVTLRGRTSCTPGDIRN